MHPFDQLYRRLGLVIGIFLFMSSVLVSPVVATTDFFLVEDIGTSARHVGLGMIDGYDPSSATLFSNPAGLHRIKNTSIAVFATTFMDQVEYRNIAMAIRVPIGVFGLGYQEATVFDNANTSSEVHSDPLSFFDYRNNVLKLSYEYSLKSWLHLGTNLSYFSHRFSDVNGTGANLDLGAILFYHRIEFSLALRNVLSFSDLEYNGGVSENLPFRGSLGVRVPIWDFDIYAQYHQRHQVGLYSGAISFTPHFLDFLTLYAGYRQYDILSKVSNNLTFGVGLKLLNVGLSYAYERSDHFEFDHKNYFSVDVNF